VRPILRVTLIFVSTTIAFFAASWGTRFTYEAVGNTGFYEGTVFTLVEFFTVFVVVFLFLFIAGNSTISRRFPLTKSK
jgi:hypothetical protein